MKEYEWLDVRFFIEIYYINCPYSLVEIASFVRLKLFMGAAHAAFVFGFGVNYGVLYLLSLISVFGGYLLLKF